MGAGGPPRGNPVLGGAGGAGGQGVPGGSGAQFNNGPLGGNRTGGPAPGG